METSGDDCSSSNLSLPETEPLASQASALSSNVFLDRVGEVRLTSNSDGLSWKLLESLENNGRTCLGIELSSEVPTQIQFSDTYAVELINHGVLRGSSIQEVKKCFRGFKPNDSEMYRFRVYSFQKSKSQPCLWVLAAYTFGSKDLKLCWTWVNSIKDRLKMDAERPKRILVFINPRSGKANGRGTWETVSPIFSRAQVQTEVIVTQRAAHAFDVMKSITNEELNKYDGVIAVGGDGFFNEILNGFLSARHKAPFPPAPSDFVDTVVNNSDSSVQDSDQSNKETHQFEEQNPLLPFHGQNGICISDFDQDSSFPLPAQKFRFGLIPAGSTDAIVICTTGTRDPVTSALHIVLGKRLCLDVAQVVRWKTTSTSEVEPFVRYAASFAGYGFYGDVITESEKYRWMGPKRYDYAGSKVFLRHRIYEAEIACLEVEPKRTNAKPRGGHLINKLRRLSKPDNCKRIICRANCVTCHANPVHSMKNLLGTPYTSPEEMSWLKSKGRFLSVGAAMMSNRNERAPDGLVADAHLSDGFMHILLVKECPAAMYLWHLTELAKKGGDPLDFDFVEHHKTTAFTFTSLGNESVWNLDGELFQAHKLSAQVFRGLISLFASGPEV